MIVLILFHATLLIDSVVYTLINKGIAYTYSYWTLLLYSYKMV